MNVVSTVKSLYDLNYLNQIDNDDTDVSDEEVDDDTGRIEGNKLACFSLYCGTVYSATNPSTS